MQGGGAEPILAAHQLLLILPGVAAHEQAMDGLVTRVSAYGLLPEIHGQE
jgi:hypothetical protein